MALPSQMGQTSETVNVHWTQLTFNCIASKKQSHFLLFSALYEPYFEDIEKENGGLAVYAVQIVQPRSPLFPHLGAARERAAPK